MPLISQVSTTVRIILCSLALRDVDRLIIWFIPIHFYPADKVRTPSVTASRADEQGNTPVFVDSVPVSRDDLLP